MRFSKQKLKWILIVFALLIFTVLVSAVILSSLEDLSYIDSFYVMSTTCNGLGLGDIVPVTNGGKVFISFISYLGIGFFFTIIGLITLEEENKKKYKLNRY